MKLYYLQTEYQPGKHRIVKVLYNVEDFAFDPSVLSPYAVLTIDELAPDNRGICTELRRVENKTDASGEGKYYIDSTGTLMEKDGWVEHILEVF